MPPPAALEAARGMGMIPRQRLLRVELPLGLPVILTGVSIVLVRGHHRGLLTNNTAYVLQGGLIVGLFAVLIYGAMVQIERRLAGRAGG